MTGEHHGQRQLSPPHQQLSHAVLGTGVISPPGVPAPVLEQIDALLNVDEQQGCFALKFLNQVDAPRCCRSQIGTDDEPMPYCVAPTTLELCRIRLPWTPSPGRRA